MSAAGGDAPAAGFDDTVHQRHRLVILAFLSGVERVEFTALRDELGLTDGNLNRHLAQLHDAGYVRSVKSRSPGRRPRTWVSMTDEGRVALEAHVAALRRVIDSIEPG